MFPEVAFKIKSSLIMSFTYPTRRESNYIMVSYPYNANVMLIKTLKSTTVYSIIEVKKNVQKGLILPDLNQHSKC